MNDFREYSNYLEHYGVKGMHWGIRHDKPRTGRKNNQRGEKETNKKKGLTDKQKKILAGLGIGAAIGYVSYRRIKDMKALIREFKGVPKLMKDIPKMEEQMDQTFRQYLSDNPEFIEAIRKKVNEL